MRAYIIRRILLTIPTVFLVSIIVFFMIRLIPGSVVDIMLSEMVYYDSLTREMVEKELGLDVPIHIQYVRWIGKILLRGDLGVSFYSRTPVLERILARLPITLELGILGLIISQLIALPIGVYSALRHDTWGDYLARSLAIGAVAVPSFWLGTLVVVLPSIWWGYSPPVAMIRFTKDPIGHLNMFLIPAIVLGLGLSGKVMRMTRAMMLEVLRQDYIRTAWAKGLKERVVVIRHALKNALIPVVSMIGLQLSVLVGGTIIIEQIFGLPGLGRLIVQSTLRRDYMVVSGTMLFFGLGMTLVNLIVDLTYSFFDPRIRYK